jgi:predicted component of type VI protein secretion system
MLARGTASLGDAVIDATEVSLVAGSSQVVDRPLHQDTRFVGIAAFYHRPGDGWRGVVERHALPPRRPLPVRMDCGQVLMTLR